MRGAFTCLGQGHWYCNQTLPTLYINKIFSRAEAYLLPIKPSASQSEQVMTAVVWEFLDIKLVWVKTHENIFTSSITLHYCSVCSSAGKWHVLSTTQKWDVSRSSYFEIWAMMTSWGNSHLSSHWLKVWPTSLRIWRRQGSGMWYLNSS